LATLVRWVAGYALRRRMALLAVVGVLLFKVGLNVLKPWPMVLLVDHVLQGRPLPVWLQRMVEALPGAAGRGELVTWAVGGTVVIFLLSWAAGLAESIAGIRLGQRMVYDVAADLFARLQQMSLRFHTSRSVGDSIRRVTADSACVAAIFRDALVPALTSVVSIASMCVILWRVNGMLTLVALAVLPILVLAFRRYAGPMQDLGYRQQEAEAGMYEAIEQTFTALPIVQAYGREPEAQRRFDTATGRTLETTMDLTRVQLRFKVLVGLSTALGTAGILWFGGRLGLEGRFSVGSILLFLSYLGSLYAPIEALMYMTSTLQGAAGSARRVIEVLRAPMEVQDRPNAIPLREVQGAIRIEEVTFGYAPDRPVLGQVSLAVQPGETIALVGATGAGKTTLVGLIPRFFDPWTGRVWLDGRDLRDWRLRSLRESVGMVLQDPFLFPLTVAENIAYSRPHASLAEIESAARAAGAHEFIVGLPQGYRTPIGERGGTLSVGQRQRLSIARALLKNAPILILDEPSSALDVETERALLNALGPLTAGRTTFIIAHRLSTIQRAHRIAVLDRGRIVECGTPDELLRQNGAYARLHRLQFEPAPTANATPAVSAGPE
jgi:ATP-binding cassette subfamily B protein/subfamily B ATP-binding cassette protein MsbA